MTRNRFAKKITAAFLAVSLAASLPAATLPAAAEEPRETSGGSLDAEPGGYADPASGSEEAEKGYIEALAACYEDMEVLSGEIERLMEEAAGIQEKLDGIEGGSPRSSWAKALGACLLGGYAAFNAAEEAVTAKAEALSLEAELGQTEQRLKNVRRSYSAMSEESDRLNGLILGEEEPGEPMADVSPSPEPDSTGQPEEEDAQPAVAEPGTAEREIKNTASVEGSVDSGTFYGPDSPDKEDQDAEDPDGTGNQPDAREDDGDAGSQDEEPSEGWWTDAGHAGLLSGLSNIPEGPLTEDEEAVSYGGHFEAWHYVDETAELPEGCSAGSDGIIRDAEGFICAGNPELKEGTIVETSLGTAKIYAAGCASGFIEIYAVR